MNVFRSRPALRWLVPSAAAVVVIGGGAAAGTIVASADPALPERSAAQLLVDVQNAKVEGLSGTIVQTADLGLPAVPGVTGQGDELTKLIAGSNTARVWYAGEDQARVAIQGVLGQTDIIRNGTDVWIWRSQNNTASHLKVPADKAGKAQHTPPAGVVPSTPQEAADAALAAIDPTTAVSTTGAAEVAGRDAYELVLAPKDSASLIGQVRLAIDAKEHIPLRVDVYAKDANNPAVRVAFQQVSFTKPDAQQFNFNPPPGAKVENQTAEQLQAEAEKKGAEAKQKHGEARKQAAESTKVVGKGWTSVFVAQAPKADDKADDKKAAGPEAAALEGVLKSLPAVKGSWGSGHLLQSTLFSALATDDGRILVGAVAPEKLYEVAAQK
ncbi:sigma-E factor regulatory protein RseB domain-containing protein [Actinoplanes sp. NPDC089786]|uniref:LolA family protein n=1 Tax=Actinoplanes sp. NPDC089786 TaxID=3155185 RepID=UPI00341D2739